MVSALHNVATLRAQRALAGSSRAIGTSIEHLSTGLKINRGADDPAGLIVSENLRAERAGIQQGIENASRASNVLATAEAGLSEVSTLLNDLESLLISSANTAALSKEEIDANQLQADSILQTIGRIANTTQFNGIKLLDGSYNGTFNIGATVSAQNQLSVSIGSFSPGNLGDPLIAYLSALSSGGSHAFSSNRLEEAQKVVVAARKQVSNQRATLGAVQHDTLDAMTNSMLVVLENTTNAESQIRDTDFAAETAELARQQILRQTSTAAIQIAGERQGQLVLDLLAGAFRR